MTVHNAASSDHALGVAIVWWPTGIALAIVCFVVAYRLFVRRPLDD